MTDTAQADRIERRVDLEAPPARVWRALTDHEEFGAWFRVRLDQPFAAGALSTGAMTYPGFEGWPWRATVEALEPERRFAFRWHDYDPEAGRDIAGQATTLVEFLLEPAASGGTRLTIVESGFENLPDHRRLAVLRDNTRGWEIQAGNLADHLKPDAGA